MLDFYLLGLARSGTTALAYALNLPVLLNQVNNRVD